MTRTFLIALVTASVAISKLCLTNPLIQLWQRILTGTSILKIDSFVAVLGSPPKAIGTLLLNPLFLVKQVWCNCESARHPPSCPRSWLKKKVGCASFFQPSSQCSDIWSNTLPFVWYITSVRFDNLPSNVLFLAFAVYSPAVHICLGPSNMATRKFAGFTFWTIVCFHVTSRRRCFFFLANPLGIELYCYAKVFFCFGWKTCSLIMWVKTLYRCSIQSFYFYFFLSSFATISTKSGDGWRSSLAKPFENDERTWIQLTILSHCKNK